MFVDEASITVRGGDGGDGCVSFRREKYVPKGGPDGGDGGHGGSVVLIASTRVSTLLAFRRNRAFRSPNGRHGQGSNRTGASGEDLLLPVPVGTVVYDEDGTRCLADLSEPGGRFVAARGGSGGRGNARFAGPTNRAPTRRDLGRPGEQRTLRLELKLLADVGLLGFPNAGKSTLVSRVSAARPKIADYPFTTLEPHLGVVDRGDFRSFVVADIPGLIEGAHRGIGLGHRFLRHVERCRLLLHLVDPTDSSRDPVEGIRSLVEELRRFRPEMAARPTILVLTKADAVQDRSPVEAVRDYAARHALACHTISAVTGEGLEPLIREVGERLDRLLGGGTDPEVLGVLGGTFDPVHLGHLGIADRARRLLGLSRVLLLPAAHPPHKISGELSPPRHREAMLRLALEGRPGLEICTLELHRDRVSYTFDTLRRLREGPPPRQPLFLIGMDGLLQITTWHRYRELLDEFDVIVIDRPGVELDKVRDRLGAVCDRIVSLTDDAGLAARLGPLQPGRGGRIFHLRIPPVPISSSAIRELAREGRSLDGLVPPVVAEYIQRTGLYRKESRR